MSSAVLLSLLAPKAFFNVEDLIPRMLTMFFFSLRDSINSDNTGSKLPQNREMGREEMVT